MLPYPRNQGPNPFIDTPTTTNWRDKELPSRPIAADSPSPVPSYTSRWYRTKRGIAIIILAVLIVISIIVGVAVAVSGEQKKQAATIAAVGADSDSTTPDPDPVTSASSSVIPSSTARDKPHSPLGPVHSTPTPSLSVVPLITPSTGIPQATRPSTTALSTPTSSGSVNPGQGSNEGNAGQGDQQTPWYCQIFRIGC